jgi:hypothetical protein
MREVYEYKYKYKYKYKYGYEERADQWLGREPYDDGCVEEPMERQQNRYIRVKNAVGPYEADVVIRPKIGYELNGKRVGHPETKTNIPELVRGQERTFQIPERAPHVDVEIEELKLLPIPPYARWPQLCIHKNIPLPYCINVKASLFFRIIECQRVNC